jgi:hypothetical protein
MATKKEEIQLKRKNFAAYQPRGSLKSAGPLDSTATFILNPRGERRALISPQLRKLRKL